MKKCLKSQVSVKCYTNSSIGPGAYMNPESGKPTSKMESKPNNIFVTKVG